MFVQRIRGAYFTPLYKIPGPWYARFTARRLKYAIVMGRRVHYVQALHDKYGPVVRIAPNEVTIADAAAAKEIHSMGSPYLKLHIDVGPVQNIFSTADPKEHGVRRRFYAKSFSQASLRKHWEPAVRDNVKKAVSKIRQDAQSGTADVFKWWMFMANDIVSLMTVGEGSSKLEQGKKYSDVLTAEELHITLGVRQFSQLLYTLGRLFSPVFPTLDKIFYFEKSFFAYGGKAIQSIHTGGQTFFTRALQDAKAENALAPNSKVELTDMEIAVDATGFQLAGSDTIAITLTFIVWCVLNRPQLRKQLEEEVAGITGEVTDAACEQLPLLNAVIDETLRLHGGAPTSLRRSVPPGGATLGGYRIPDTAVVATQAFSLHRNPDIWENPET
jgi:averufin monooxygenase